MFAKQEGVYSFEEWSELARIDPAEFERHRALVSEDLEIGAPDCLPDVIREIEAAESIARKVIAFS